MDFAQYTVIEPSAGTSSPEGRQRPKKVHEEANSVASPAHFVEPKDDVVEEKKVAVEATNFDNSACSSRRPGGRKSAAKNSIPSPGFTAVMDRMYEKTDLFAKRWGELLSLITSEKAHRLATKIRDFYTTVDQQADKKRQKLQAPAASSSVGEKGTFKDLQGNLALTARKIYECAKGVPDEEKCRAAAEFVEEVFSEFKRTDVAVMIFLRRCLLSVEFACPKLRSDRETVMAAVQQDGLALQLASEKLQNTKEVVIAAVRNNGLALQFASEELQSDREVVIAAVQQDGRACLFASEDVRRDKELAMVTAGKGGISHQFECKELNYDRHFNDVLQSADVSPAIVDFYRTLEAFIDANQTHLSQSTSLLELLDKSHKLQQVVGLHQAMEKFVREGDVWLWTLIKGGVDLNQEYRHPQQPQHERLTPLRHVVALNSGKLITALCQEDDLFGADGACSTLDSPDMGKATKADAVFLALAKYPVCLRATEMTPEIIKGLAKAGVDVNFADKRGRTALHFHAVEGHLEVVRALLENDACLDQRDSDGKTPLDLATEAGAPEELLKLLDYVELHIGLNGQPIALPTSLLAEPPDVVSFLKHYVRNMKFKNGERVSYFTIRVAIGDKVAKNITSWEGAGKPKIIFVTLGCNFREDRERAKQFLKAAVRRGADADYELRGHLEEYQDPDALDHEGERAETTAYKAARNGDVRKLELLYLACANFDLQDSGGATALFIASQNGHLATVRFLLDHRAQVDLALHTNATPLYVSCQNGHLQVAEILLAFGAVPNSQTDDEATPLFIAAQMGHFGIVKKLLEFNGDIKLANRTKATPLFIAAQNDHDDIAMCLLLAGSDINACTNGGASPTYIAAQKGCMKVLALLMEAPGVDANLSANDGATPILIAAQNGHQEAVRFLLKKKVDVTKAMKSGATALFVAAQNGYLEVVQDLVAANKSLVNMCLQNGTSPLYVAAQNGHLDVVKYLQQEGADTREKSCGGASPFFIAAQNGRLPILIFLRDVEHKSPRPDIETQLTEQTDDGSAPLLVAAQNGHFDVVQFLTSELKKLPVTEERKQQLIDHQKKGGASALYLASQNGHESVVYHLIQLGASVNQALDTKETALFIASQGGHTLVAQHLLEARGDVNQGKHDQTTPLYIASQNNHTDTFRLLLHERADPNVQNANGATPLFISSQKGHNDIVRELLDTNADPTLPIKSGACPLYIAAMKGECEVCITLLKSRRADVNQTPGHGTTPLLISIRNHHVEVADLFLEHPDVDVDKADLQGNTPLLTAIKEDLRHLVEKLISRCAKVDHGIFDDGIAILRGLANALVSIAPASARALQRSEIPPSGYPHASDASAESLEQYREFFKKTSEEAKALLHQLHKVDEGLRNLANESLSSGTKQQVEQLRKLFQKVPDPDKGSWTCGNLSLADLFQSVHKVVKASHYNDRLLDPGEAREKLLMAGSQVLHACSLMRVYIEAAEKVFLPFLKRCSGHGCGTAEKDRMQQLITKQICELLQASKLEGGLETLFKPMGTDFTAKPVCQSIGTVDSGAKPVCESPGVEDFTLKPGMPGRRSVYTTKSA